MRRDLLKTLVCPGCRGPLSLTVEREEGGEVIAGSLRCAACDDAYLIQDTIPNLLPKKTKEG